MDRGRSALLPLLDEVVENQEKDTQLIGVSRLFILAMSGVDFRREGLASKVYLLHSHRAFLHPVRGKMFIDRKALNSKLL